MLVTELQELEEVKSLLTKGHQVGVLSYGEVSIALKEVELDDAPWGWNACVDCPCDEEEGDQAYPPKAFVAAAFAHLLPPVGPGALLGSTAQR